MDIHEIYALYGIPPPCQPNTENQPIEIPAVNINEMRSADETRSEDDARQIDVPPREFNGGVTNLDGRNPHRQPERAVGPQARREEISGINPATARTFAQALTGEEEDDMVVLAGSKAPRRVGGNIVVAIDMDDYKQGLIKHQFAVLGRVIQQKGDRPTNTRIITEALKKAWKINFRLLALGKGYFNLYFDSMQDQTLALTKGAVNINPGMFRVSPWIRDFNPEKQKQTNTQVWIHIHDLPPEYWGKKNLFNIASGVGVPLKFDEKTIKLEKGVYARALVDVDLALPLPESLLVEREEVSFYVKISYEELPDFCSSCAAIGHSDLKCRFRLPMGGQQEERHGIRQVINDNQRRGRNESRAAGHRVGQQQQRRGDAQHDEHGRDARRGEGEKVENERQQVRLNIRREDRRNAHVEEDSMEGERCRACDLIDTAALCNMADNIDNEDQDNEIQPRDDNMSDLEGHSVNSEADSEDSNDTLSVTGDTREYLSFDENGKPRRWADLSDDEEEDRSDIEPFSDEDHDRFENNMEGNQLGVQNDNEVSDEQKSKDSTDSLETEVVMATQSQQGDKETEFTPSKAQLKKMRRLQLAEERRQAQIKYNSTRARRSAPKNTSSQ